jgi:hypothetical protein
MATFDTKFGDLNLSSWTGSSSATNKTSGLTSKPYSFIFTSGKETYRFIPEDVIQRGFTDPDTKRQFYLTNALNKDTLKSLYEKGEAVDLVGGLTESKANELEKFGYSTKGVLVPDSDYQSLGLNKVRSYEPGIISKGAGVGFITGLGQDKKGNLMYGGEQLGRSQYAYIDQGGRKAGYEKSKWGGFLGDMFYDVGKAIAGVPFLPEILGVATGNPYVYAATKGLAAGASGEDPLKAGLKIGATIGVTQALSGPSEAGGQPAPVGGTPGVSEVFPVAPPGGTAVPLPPQSAGFGISGAGLSSAEMAALKTGTGYGETTQSLLNQDLQFVGEDAARLYNTTGSVAATQQNLIAAGVDPSMAAEASNLAALGGTGSSIAGGLGSAFPGETIFTSQGLLGGGATMDEFAKNIAGISSTSAPALSITDALRGANLANQLMGGQQTATGFPQQQSSFQPTGVDYSGIYGLLGQRPSVPGISSLLGPAQLRFPSLLG